MLARLACSLLLSATAPAALAQVHHWINPAGGAFTDPANWDTGQIPGPLSTIRFETPGTYTVTLAANANVAAAFLDAPGLSLTIDAGTHTLAIGGQPTPVGLMRVTRGDLRIINGFVTVLDGNYYMSQGRFVIEPGNNLLIEQGGGLGADHVELRSPATLDNGRLAAYASSGMQQFAPVRVLENSFFHAWRGVFQGDIFVRGGRVLGGDNDCCSNHLMGNVHVTAGGRLEGRPVATARGVIIEATALLEGDGTLINTGPDIRGTLTLRDGAAIANPDISTGIRGTGRLNLEPGGSVLHNAWLDNTATLRMHADSTGPLLLYTNAQGITYECVIDAAAAPRFKPRSFDQSANLSGTLRVEVENPNPLRVGDEVVLFLAPVPFTGSFHTFTAPALGGGRALALVTEPTRVLVRVIPGPPSCFGPDFNGDGAPSTEADIQAFFACLAGDCCPTCASADFNGDGDTGTDADIEAFFRVLAGDPC